MSLNVSSGNKSRCTKVNDLILINLYYTRMGILNLPVLKSSFQYFNLEVRV